MSRTLLTALCSALLCASPVWADVYTWTDANGNTVYSDKPNPNAKRIEVSAPNSMEAKADSRLRKQQLQLQQQQQLRSQRQLSAP